MDDRLNVSCLMHVPFEEPGFINDWISRKKHDLSITRLFKNEVLPERSEIDMLIIMGGPMNVYDFHIHAWMQEEIEWVSSYIDMGKPVIGICLGAQIIAASMGVQVYPGENKEIGWHNLQFLPALGDFKIWDDLPPARKVFHWHGDTFPIPEGAVRIAGSQAYPNQGFIFDQKVLALQFHLEITPEGITDLVKNCREELVPGPFIQAEEEILAETRYFRSNKELMFDLLDYLSRQIL